MQSPPDIGSRLELFVDDFLVDTLDGAAFKMHEPLPAPPAASPVSGGYMTVFKDGGIYRAYYRSSDEAYRGETFDGNPGELTCYAQSEDGAEWAFPELGLCEVGGSRRNNVILTQAPFCHNFSPFRDANPAASAEARYKALAGKSSKARKPGSGLHAFQSPDGIRWTLMHDGPVFDIPHFGFDSQNIPFWSEAEGRYVCFFRTFETPHGRLRTVWRTASDDFLHWDEPTPMNPNLLGEQLYTSQTHPYFRAPHIYVALPTRFMHGSIAGEPALNEEGKPMNVGTTDILFMSARAGASKYDRLFTEAFIRPGLDPARWENRANYAACGIVPTGPGEMSLYNARAGQRFTMRTDGFISIHAGAAPGEMLTKPFVFSGKELALNYGTSAAGSVQVEMQTAEGQAAPGLSLEDCRPLVGDRIAQTVSWKSGSGVGALAGKPVRLRFRLQEADVYSMQFRS